VFEIKGIRRPPQTLMKKERMHVEGEQSVETLTEAYYAL
jgi:hypothetical protein